MSGLMLASIQGEPLELTICKQLKVLSCIWKGRPELQLFVSTLARLARYYALSAQLSYLFGEPRRIVVGS